IRMTASASGSPPVPSRRRPARTATRTEAGAAGSAAETAREKAPTRESSERKDRFADARRKGSTSPPGRLEVERPDHRPGFPPHTALLLAGGSLFDRQRTPLGRARIADASRLNFRARIPPRGILSGEPPTMRRIVLLAILLCLLIPLALAAAINRGYYFPEDNPSCTWTCAAGNSGSANAGSLTICR